MNESKPMTPSEVIVKAIELNQAYTDGILAQRRFNELKPRLNSILAPMEGKLIDVSINYTRMLFLVKDGSLQSYTAPEQVYAWDLDKNEPEEVTANGHPDPLRIHELDANVA